MCFYVFFIIVYIFLFFHMFFHFSLFFDIFSYVLLFFLILEPGVVSILLVRVLALTNENSSSKGQLKHRIAKAKGS